MPHNPTKPIKTALLAYGMSGKVFHAPFIHCNPNFDLYAVLERNKNEAKKDYPHIISYANIQHLLADSQIQLVIINTPNYTHFEFARQALYAGKHVLIEKPFCTNPSQAKQLFALGKAQNLHVMAYQNRRFDSDFLTTKAVIQSGKLGKITEAHVRFDRFKNTISPKKFKETPLPAAGIFYDLGAHVIDQAIALFGPPQSFTKTYGQFRLHSQVDDFAHAHLHYTDSKNVFITTNMLVLKPKAAFTIYGTHGTFTKTRADEQENQLIAGISPTDKHYGIEKPNNEASLCYINDTGQTITQSIPSPKGNYMELYNQVFLTIVHNKPYFISPNDILAQLEILVRNDI
ncbi:MAG: oxidoreductase [Sphingobacteriales bacterium]|nr:MAG: oxidoreductase [Sphingobacteriales bacterium]TAF81092.1 MAG: oxidoreductase [Sphingobacteriales bacterium]